MLYMLTIISIYFNILGTSVDLLVVVKGLGQIRTVSSKNNESLQVRTAEVFDHTCLSLRIEIWEPDIIQRYIY